MANRHALIFDAATGQFVFHAARFGPDSRAEQVAAAIGQPLKDLPQPGWQQVERDDGEIVLSLSFKDGVLHSGSIIAHVDAAGWDDLPEKSRAAHEALMRRLFGADSFESKGFTAYMARHPKDGIERIMFEVR